MNEPSPSRATRAEARLKAVRKRRLETSRPRWNERWWWVVPNSPIVVTSISVVSLAIAGLLYQYTKDQEGRREVLGKLIEEYQNRVDLLMFLDGKYPPEEAASAFQTISALTLPKQNIVKGKGDYQPTDPVFRGINMFNIIDEIDEKSRITITELPVGHTLTSIFTMGIMLPVMIHKFKDKFNEFGVRRGQLYDARYIPLEYFDIQRDEKLKLVGLDAATLQKEIDSELKKVRAEDDLELKKIEDLARDVVKK